MNKFKKSGESFQLLSQTLNCYDSLCFPVNPQCRFGDKSSTHDSNSAFIRFSGTAETHVKIPQKMKMLWNLRITFVGSGEMASQYF